MDKFKKLCYFTNTQLRFASAGFEGDLGPLRLARHTRKRACISEFKEGT